MNRLADVIRRIADYDYVYDPEHKRNPGGGYVKTDKGWSKRDGVGAKSPGGVIPKERLRGMMESHLDYKSIPDDMRIPRDKNRSEQIKFMLKNYPAMAMGHESEIAVENVVEYTDRKNLNIVLFARKDSANINNPIKAGRMGLAFMNRAKKEDGDPDYRDYLKKSGQAYLERAVGLLLERQQPPNSWRRKG